MAEAAARAGAPAGSIGWMKTVTLEGTQELMKHRDVAVILATGGMGLVRAAYSAGKPAYGVGPGNAPCYIERSADLKKAAQRHHRSARRSTTASSARRRTPSSSTRPVAEEAAARVPGARRLLPEPGARWTRWPRCLSRRSGCRIPALVGKPAAFIAEKVGMKVPSGTRALIAPLTGVGRDYPLSIEKLCPVLSWYVVKDWREGCERCIQILRYGGMGHTMSIHSKNDDVILQFGLKKPAFRICVNTPTTHGSIGLTTGLDPAMTLGCGGWGGNITSDNISPRHLLNIKRLAYELRPAVASVPACRSRRHSRRLALAESAGTIRSRRGFRRRRLAARIDQFLASRGYKAADRARRQPAAADSHALERDKPDPGRVRLRRRRPGGD